MHVLFAMCQVWEFSTNVPDGILQKYALTYIRNKSSLWILNVIFFQHWKISNWQIESRSGWKIFFIILLECCQNIFHELDYSVSDSFYLSLFERTHEKFQGKFEQKKLHLVTSFIKILASFAVRIHPDTYIF